MGFLHYALMLTFAHTYLIDFSPISAIYIIIFDKNENEAVIEVQCVQRTVLLFNNLSIVQPEKYHFKSLPIDKSSLKQF